MVFLSFDCFTNHGFYCFSNHCLYCFSNVGDNLFPSLPTEGMSKVGLLKTFGNRYLKDFPPTKVFEDIQVLELSYAYHCCEFLPKAQKVGNHDNYILTQF